MWSQRMLVHAARVLADHGLLVLRFDYRGQGESSGNYEETSVRTRIEDIGAALALLRNRVDGAPVFLLGARLGGTLALRASANDPHGIGVALWEPVLDTAAYVQELLRVNISTQMMMFKKVLRNRTQLADAIAAGEKVSVNGFDLCRPFVEELDHLNPVRCLAQSSGRRLLLLSPSSKYEGTSSEEVLRLEFPVFWKEPKNYYGSLPALEDATLAWIRRSTPSVGSTPGSPSGRTGTARGGIIG